jgi:hypothetical protein
MKKQIIILIGLAFLILTFNACKKDWLEVPPEGQITPEGYYSTDQRAAELVNAIYNAMLAWDVHSFPWIGVTSIASDDATKGSVDGDNGTDKDKLDNFTFTPTDISFNELWVGNYRGITRANTALANLPDLSIDEGLKTRYMAEAHFLRAYFYFNLVRLYGDVPLVDKVIDPTNQEELDKINVRVSADEIYTLIIQDLEYANENLPLKSMYSPDDLGRVTKGAAQGMLAKVYMYRGNWQQVSELTNEVINSGEYQLVPDYSTIWREIGENNAESLFEVQAVGDPLSLGIEGYYETQAIRNQFGWGFNTPSQSLEDAYEPGDPRKDATIIFPGETLWDGTVIISDAPNPRYNQKSYVSRTQETFNGDTWVTNKNLRILRYAEILLMKAEAANELGDVENAKSALNQVRQRVGLPDITVTDQAELRNIIWHERRVELAMEHDRYFDVVRQGRGEEVFGTLGFVSGKHEVFPIPQNQIDISGGTLIQNPGY